MIRVILLASLLAAQSTTTEKAGRRRLDPRWRPSAEDVRRYDYLHARYLRSYEKGFEEEEKRLAAACDARLGPGSYSALVDFHGRCDPTKDCNRLALADLYEICDAFAAGEKASPALGEKLLHAVGAFKPGPHAAELGRVAEPFAKALLKKKADRARYDAKLAELLKSP